MLTTLSIKLCLAEDDFDFGDDVIVVTSRFSEAIKATENELESLRLSSCGTTLSNPILVTQKNFGKKFTQITRVTGTERSPVDTNVINELANRYEVIIMPWLKADDSLVSTLLLTLTVFFAAR